MNESVLIGKSEKFLDYLQKQELSFKEVCHLEGFLEIYQNLNHNLEELQDLRETMENKGYKAPYRSLARYGSSPTAEVMVEEMHDSNRHSQYFRMKAAAKKNILDRVKSSISSHKIAMGNLEEYGLIKCKSCSKKYRVFEIYYQNNSFSPCSCNSSNFELEVNKQGVWQLGIIPHLPLSGDYMVKMSHLTAWGRESFKKIIKVLKQERKGVVKTISLVIKVMESGRWIRKRITIDAEDNENYERDLRNKYGSNMRIEFLQFHRKKPAILNDRHTRTALALSYVQFAEKIVEEIEEKVISHYIKNPAKLQLYDDLVLESKSIAEDPLGEFENLEEIQEEKLNKLLIENGLMTSYGDFERELQQDLNSRSRLEKKIFPGISLTLIMWDIIKYYLSTSYDRRNKFSGPFPYLRPNMDRNQIKVFQEFDKEVVDILKIFNSENIEYIPHIQNIVAKKFDMEQKMKGLHMKSNPPAFGAAVLSLESEIPTKRCAELFSVSLEELNMEKRNIETFGKPSTTKAKKFLEMIKK